MNKTGPDYKKDFGHRVGAEGIRDKKFFEQFFRSQEVESELKSAYSTEIPGRYEEELDYWVDKAKDLYNNFWSVRPALAAENPKQQQIRPTRRQPPRKKGGVAGPWERQDALAQYLETVVSGNWRIRGFRGDILSGRLLSKTEALTFLSSPLAAHIPRPPSKSARAKTLGKLLDTNYELKEGQDERGRFKKLIRGRSSYTLRPLLEVPEPIFPGDSVALRDMRNAAREAGVVVFPHPWEERYIVAARKSILAYVVSLVEDSMRSYPISREMGVWFVLTGKFIPEDPARIYTATTLGPELHRTSITLEVEAWLPPEDVLEQYRHAQIEVLGKTPRSLKRETLDVFNFVNRHSGEPWRDLLQAWNKAYPRRRFEDPRHLYQTYTRTFEHVTGLAASRGRPKVADTEN